MFQTLSNCDKMIMPKEGELSVDTREKFILLRNQQNHIGKFLIS